MKTFILLTVTLVIGASYASNNITDEAQPPESRIVNGNEASLTDMPYQVGLFIYNLGSTTLGSKCGGALISERVVLTAAHCFINRQQRGEAYLGSNRYKTGRRVTFNRVLVHEFFRPLLRQNDIALVYLDRPVQPNGFTIKIIRLDTNYLTKNTKVTVSGYGWIANGVDTDKLYYTEMTTRSKLVCSSLKVPFIKVMMICAKGVYGRETCQGDSGSPVVKNWPYNPSLVGLVSFEGGCQKNTPSVFTRTASYTTWITKNMYNY